MVPSCERALGSESAVALEVDEQLVRVWSGTLPVWPNAMVQDLVEHQLSKLLDVMFPLRMRECAFTRFRDLPSAEPYL